MIGIQLRGCTGLGTLDNEKVQRLGKNTGGYFGETVEIAGVISDIEQAGVKSGWSTEPLPVTERLQLVTMRREVPGATSSVYISAGIHGDEPGGPLAVRQLMLENAWPPLTTIYLCACLNPEGFRLNRRENEAGIDLNRDYLHFQSDVVRTHAAWITLLPRFDFALCLHEDWESNGFYLYELNPDGRKTYSSLILEEVAKVCPIDLSTEIEGRPASNGLIQPNPDPASRPQWPEAFYLVNHKTRLSYTLEAPSDFPLAVRVAALVTAVKTALGAAAAAASQRSPHSTTDGP